MTLLCPTCGQPATTALGPDEGWERRNEACPEFGQPLQENEPSVDRPAPMHHFGITVSDLDRSVAFYTDYFELTEIMRPRLEGAGISSAVGRPEAKLTASLLVGRNTILELLQYDRPAGRSYELTNSDVGAAHVCFVVEDIQGLYARMVQDGVVFHNPPQELGWKTSMAYCLDPDGINVELLQPGPELDLDHLIAQG